MESPPPVDVRRPRLNPFVFPSDTDFRFVLLIIAVAGASLLIYSMLYNAIPANWERHRAIEERCRTASEAAHPGTSLADSIARQDASARCTAPADRIRAVWMVGGLLVLLGLAAAIYWTFPVRKIRRDRLVPLTAEDAPEVAASLAALCDEAGLAHPPTFVWNPLNPASSGLAFGRLGRSYVALTGGLVTQFYTDQPAFRAVVLHELAHLRNADVDKTYFTVAIWQAFLLAALLPLAVAELDNPVRDIANIGWRLLGLTALVYLTRNAVLRAREVYADVRASVWDGPSGALRRVLDTLPDPARQRWSALFRVHPHPAERRRALDDTAQLFRMGFWEALGTGTAVAIALPNVEFLLSLGIPTPHAFLRPLGSALLFAPLAVGVVGVGVWRETFAALAQGETARGAGWLGIGLGLGLLLGKRLSFVALGQAQSSVALRGAMLLAFDVLWGGLLLVGLFLFFQWIAAGAGVWLEVVAASRSPRPTYRVGLVIAGAILVMWLGLLFYVDAARVAGGSLSLSVIAEHIRNNIGLTVVNGPALYALLALAVVGLFINNPLTLVALTSLWAFPLSAWLWRGRASATSGSGWALLEPSPLPLSFPRQRPLRPGLAAAMGAAGGVVFWIVSFVVHRALASSGGDLATWVLYGQTVLAVGIQAAVAAVVAGLVGRLGWLHGLFAAFVAGCLMSGGAIGLVQYFLKGIPPGFVWIAFSQMVNGGALLALPAAVSVSVLAAWFGRSRAADRGDDGHASHS